MSLSLDPTVELDLDALCARAAQLLEHAGADTADGRVRERPDPRTVRYYQTLGLLDRPLRYDGRRALYGHRHLMQVVAVKCLQARGLSLAQAQQALAVASTAQLEAAVREALSAPDAPPPPAVLAQPEQTSPIDATPWRAVELAPGVLVVVDPRIYPPEHSAALIERLRAAAPAAPSPQPPRGARP
jgi:DNA-binding transcriptional MerR regulator